MGHFANLYLVEISNKGDITEVKTTIYSGEMKSGSAYFSWGEGERPKSELNSFAGNTLFCDQKLEKLPGYPLIEKYDVDKIFLLEVTWMPKHRDSAILIHLIIEDRYIPVRDRQPFRQPAEASIYKKDNKLLITYPVEGKADLCFNVAPLDKGESINQYDLQKLIQPEKPKSRKLVTGINFLFGKLEWHIEG